MSIDIFGVRHLSPMAALDLRRFLDEKNPKVVLIEGPSDATDQLKHLAHAKTRPPVALLAFTKSRPVRTIVYPLAAYSPHVASLSDPGDPPGFPRRCARRPWSPTGRRRQQLGSGCVH